MKTFGKTMNKINRLSTLFGLLLIILPIIVSCEKDKAEPTSPLLIGKTEDISEVTLPAKAERKIILRGGNGKYDASIVDATIARVTIVHDTIKVEGLLEGTTYATVSSADQSRKLTIHVQAPDISVSAGEVALTPGATSETISVTGGGLGLKMMVDNPEGAIEEPRLNHTGKLYIKALHEGDATITFSAAGKQTHTITVRVRQTATESEYGIYTTTNSTPYKVMATPLISERRGKGFILWASAIPTADGKRIFVPLTSTPTAGEVLTLSLASQGMADAYRTGSYRLVVEEVTDRLIRLRAPGFRLILPHPSQG